MVHRLGCELSDRVAAIAPVSGLLLDVDLDAAVPTRKFACAPPRPVPIFEIHGKLDKLALYDGGKSTCLPDFPTMPSVIATIDGWRKRNGCAASTTVTLTQGAATCRAFESCAAGAATVLCSVADSGHAYVGGTQGPSLDCLEPYSNAIVATDKIWEFFLSHPRP